MQALRGTAEMQFFGDGDEVAEVTKFDIAIHIETIIIPRNKILDVWCWVGGDCKKGDDTWRCK